MITVNIFEKMHRCGLLLVEEYTNGLKMHTSGEEIVQTYTILKIYPHLRSFGEYMNSIQTFTWYSLSKLLYTQYNIINT